MVQAITLPFAEYSPAAILINTLNGIAANIRRLQIHSFEKSSQKVSVKDLRESYRPAVISSIGKSEFG